MRAFMLVVGSMILGGLLGGAIAWLWMLVLAPNTLIDDAMKSVAIGFLLGGVAGLSVSALHFSSRKNRK